MDLCLTTGSPEKQTNKQTKALVCSACWFLWCNFSQRLIFSRHHDSVARGAGKAILLWAGMSGIQHTTGKLMRVGWVLWKFLPRIKSPAVGPSSPMWWESETPRGSNRKLSWSGCWPHTACLGTCLLQFSSVQFSRSVTSNSLRPHESQHARPPCSSPSPGVHS